MTPRITPLIIWHLRNVVNPYIFVAKTKIISERHSWPNLLLAYAREIYQDGSNLQEQKLQNLSGISITPLKPSLQKMF